MSVLSKLTPPKGDRKKRHRVGRGNASGWGVTAGRGTKGQSARAGGNVRPGFEGGQMPLARRLPKFGFYSRNRVRYNQINLDRVQQIADELHLDTIDMQTLVASGVVKKEMDGLKVLGRGELSRALTIIATKFSQHARTKIEQAGGRAEEV